MNKLGSYISKLMTTVLDKEQEQFVKDLALSELQRLNVDVSEFINKHLKDEFDNETFKSEFNHMRQFKFDNNDIKAFSILGISVGLKWQKIQEKFKVLVKKFHPDMNSGNKKYEEKLKLITLAYTQLKNTYRKKIDT